MSPTTKLPNSLYIIYASGMMGWSVMINLIAVVLVYFYLPPITSGLPPLVTQASFLGIFNALALITASGRLVDAFYDPLIAQISDKSKNPKGRRTPIMLWAILPSIVFCFLIFYPLELREDMANIWWLIFTLIGFYVATTSFIIPYNALLPELARSAEEKVKLSSWQSAGFVLGIGISSNTFNIAHWITDRFAVENIQAIQITVIILAGLGGLMMLVTAAGIDERLYTNPNPVSIPLNAAIKQTIQNRNFRLFIVADFSYFIAITIITSGLVYFITILLELSETIGNKLMITMVLTSFLFYPVINKSARKWGKKILVLISFGLLCIIFLGVIFLGRVPVDPTVQIFTLIIIAAIPIAALNILPNAILAEIIEEDAIITNTNKEAVYFAVRYFFVKIAQTFGVAVFSMMLLYGKDIGNDTGIRLAGAVGFILALLAGIIFNRFQETRKA